MAELLLRKLSQDTDLSDFNCGLAVMDKFIHTELQKVLSAQQNYSGYYLSIGTEIVALFVIDIETVIIDEDTYDDMQLIYGIEQNSGTEYNSLEILYLAVKEEYRKQGIGSMCIDKIVSMAEQSSALGVQFITVDAYKSHAYTAIPFYHRHNFIDAEYNNPNKNTLRMIRPVYIPPTEIE